MPPMKPNPSDQDPDCRSEPRKAALEYLLAQHLPHNT